MTNQTLNTVQSRTPLQQPSRFRKDDFEMGFILQSKGDREMVYIARKKFNQADQTIRNANINTANSDAVSTSNMGPAALPNDGSRPPPPLRGPSDQAGYLEDCQHLYQQQQEVSSF